jgi:hypothetical protein
MSRWSAAELSSLLARVIHLISIEWCGLVDVEVVVMARLEQ